MSQLTLETLPSDAIVEILHAFGNFDDLYGLIRCSAVCYWHFVVCKSSILNCVARNMIRGSWEEATVILRYQLGTERPLTASPLVRSLFGPDLVTLKQSLETPFVLCASNIPRLVFNHRLVEQCRERYTAKYLRIQRFPSATARQQTPYQTLLPAPAATSSVWFYIPPNSRTLTLGHDIPTSFFYKTWVFNFRYEYDGIPTFSHRYIFTGQEYADLQTASRFFFANCRGRPMWEKNMFQTTIQTLWVSWYAAREPVGGGVGGVNTALFVKMIRRHPGLRLFRRGDYGEFVRDYGVMGVEALVGKYKLE